MAKENDKQFIIFKTEDKRISVGYRVKSLCGIQFRQWVTKRLNEYIRKGFTMDDEQLKNLGKSFSMVNGYVCNRQQPSLEVLYQISKILQMNVKDLLKGKKRKRNNFDTNEI
jgi:hypothetical protein